VHPLVERPPRHLPPDPARRTTLEFTSPADGSRRRVDVAAPARADGTPLPLVLAPHPITWTAAEDYHGGMPGLKRGHHRGWRGLADRHGVLVASPHGHHRRVELCSLASPEQIADLAALPDELERAGYSVDRTRVYACGLSMGALEALVVAGRHPDLFAGVVAFNPVIDVAAWHEDLSRTPVEEIRRFGTAQRIHDEVGGAPSEVPDAYAERSATTYVAGLARAPTLLLWSAHDVVVPRQESHHAHRLYREVKRVDAARPTAEYEHTQSHGVPPDDELTRWRLHEWCDYDLALAWLLRHRRPT